VGALRRCVGTANVTFEIRKYRTAGKLFARWLAEVVTDSGAALQADVVVPLQRERERGYNQAALIAKPLAKRLGLSYKSVLLTRIRPWRFCHTSGQPS
jgi:predicted amidophosphoribosyltransferase